jgi:hypothetical protein
MLDLWTFGITKKFLKRPDKLEEVNLQTSHIATILENFMFAAIPRNVTMAFHNCGTSLVIDTDRTVQCSATPETS